MNILEGIRVIDVTAWAFVPSAGGIMAHWGADVIKVEAAGAPDPMRLLNGSSEPGRSSDMFKHYNRGKRSIAINLATPEGRDLLYRLVAEADVFLTSYLAPTRRKLGIDVDDIRKVNPRIIYARGSGYGPKGPEADRPGYDSIAWWARGSLCQSAMDGADKDWPVGMVGHGDGMSGAAFAGGICAALLKRERTGEASVVDASLMGTAVWFNGPAIMGLNVSTAPREFRPAVRPPGPGGYVTPAVRAIYQTKDNRFLNLLFLTDDDRDFADLCQRTGRPELATDPRYATSAGRAADDGALLTIFEDIFASRTLAEWKASLIEARGAWAPIQTPDEMHADPQSVANGFVRHVDYPGGALMMPVPPVLFDEEAGDPPRAPDFAEHTHEILAEAGYSAQDIARYRETGVVN